MTTSDRYIIDGRTALPHPDLAPGYALKQMFTVFECDNGYMARLPSGTVVIGKEMSECCEAAQQACATEAIRGEAERREKLAYGAAKHENLQVAALIDKLLVND